MGGGGLTHSSKVFFTSGIRLSRYDERRNYAIIQGMNASHSTTLKTALVTGATGAIGGAIARQLATKNYEVVIIARHESKAWNVVQDTITTTGNLHVRYELVDLCRRAEIQALAKRWQGPLHLLVNNAAVTPPTRQETPDGIEMQFATNVLGYFWMTQAFREILKACAPARIVDVASYWAGDLRLDDLEFNQRRYTNASAYRQSKQANRMLVAAWAERLQPDGITINTCHPGDVNSQLSNNLGFGGYQSPDQGAATPVWLATEPIGGQLTGKYFEHLQESHCRFGEDREGRELLFEACLASSHKRGVGGSQVCCAHLRTPHLPSNY